MFCHIFSLIKFLISLSFCIFLCGEFPHFHFVLYFQISCSKHSELGDAFNNFFRQTLIYLALYALFDLFLNFFTHIIRDNRHDKEDKYIQEITPAVVIQALATLDAYKLHMRKFSRKNKFDHKLTLSEADDCARELIAFIIVLSGFLRKFKNDYGAHLLSYKTRVIMQGLTCYVGKFRVKWKAQEEQLEIQRERAVRKNKKQLTCTIVKK